MPGRKQRKYDCCYFLLRRSGFQWIAHSVESRVLAPLYAGRSTPAATQPDASKRASLLHSRCNARVSSSRISCNESGLSLSSRPMLSRCTASSPIWRAPRVSGSVISGREASGIRRPSRTGPAVVANGKSRLPVVIQWITNSSTWAGQQAPYIPSREAISSCHCRTFSLSA